MQILGETVKGPAFSAAATLFAMKRVVTLESNQVSKRSLDDARSWGIEGSVTIFRGESYAGFIT
jgi:hypothetical protein